MFIPKKRLERAAEQLLADFGDGREVVAPIPVEDILESHLKLALGFQDLAAVLGREDVLGVTFVPLREVSIDHRLDPDLFPDAYGRCRFTIAHEIGHWCLHASELRKDGISHVLRTEERRKSRKPGHEFQADYFAGCLLMPRELVQREWSTLSPPADRAADFDPACEMARRFEVSEQAMRIRLVELGLVPSPTEVAGGNGQQVEWNSPPTARVCASSL